MRPEAMDGIRNRDIRMIMAVPAMRAEIETLEDRMEWVRARAEKITRQLSSAGGGGGRGLEDTVAELVELEERYKRMIRSYSGLLKAAERKLIGLENMHLRAFIELAYLTGAKGPEIQRKLNMSRWAYENAKRQLEAAEGLDGIRWHYGPAAQ